MHLISELPVFILQRIDMEQNMLRLGQHDASQWETSISSLPAQHLLI
jgi:hypothetical protein